MSETLEERLRRLAEEDNATMCKVFPGDVVEYLDKRDETITLLNSRITELEADLENDRVQLALNNRVLEARAMRIIEFSNNEDYLNGRIAELKALITWQPIETAPTDGTDVLVTSTDGAWVLIGYCRGGSWMYGEERDISPTHWMPLPEPPEKK